MAENSRKRRRRPVIRDVKLEVNANWDHEEGDAVVTLTREYRERYSPLLRLVTVKKPHNPGVSGRALLPHVTLDGLSVAPLMGGEWHEGDGVTFDDVKLFLEEHVLGVKATAFHPKHRAEALDAEVDCAGDSHGGGVMLPPMTPELAMVPNQLIVRQFFHEAARFTWFLVGVAGGNCVVIDPISPTGSYEVVLDVMRRHSMTLAAIILTQCHFDVITTQAGLSAAAVTAGLAAGPTVPLVSNAFSAVDGSPAAGADGFLKGTLQSAADLNVLPLGEVQYMPRWSTRGQIGKVTQEVSIKVLPAPGTTPCSLAAALYVGESATNLFCGDLLGVDCFGRVDLWSLVPATLPAYVREGDKPDGEPIATSQLQLRSLLQLMTLPGVSDDTIVMPSHGNYCDATHALDLHWALHLGDLKKQRHTAPIAKILLGGRAAPVEEADAQPGLLCGDALATAVNDAVFAMADYITTTVRGSTAASAEALVTFPTWSANYLTNSGQVVNATTPSSSVEGPIMIDVRPPQEYDAAHAVGAVSVPMNDLQALGSKKAEIWFTPLTQPFLDINHVARRPLVVVHGAVDPVEVRARLETIGVHVAIDPTANEGSSKDDFTGAQLVSSIEGRPVEVSPAGQRLSSYADMLQLDGIFTSPTSTAAQATDDGRVALLDIRTKFEHLNGAHRDAINLPLATLIEFTNTSLRAASENDRLAVLSKYLTRLACEQGFATGDAKKPITRLILYCAAGYRSRIAVTLLRSVLGPSYDAVDLVGGALQIMTQRPDLWQIKDRSILCIS